MSNTKFAPPTCLSYRLGPLSVSRELEVSFAVRTGCFVMPRLAIAFVTVCPG